MLQDSVVAILDTEGRVAGTGFVAGDRLILTCAHVAQPAQNPAGMVRVRYHANGITVSASLLALNEHTDLALLHLGEALPRGIAPLPLGQANNDVTGQDFHAYGYPDIAMTDGLAADGSITGRGRAKDGQELFQIKSTQLAQGFSGGPVMVNGKVIGVVTAVYHADKTLKNFDTAWAIPIDLAFNLYPELAHPVPDLWPLGHAYATQPNFTGRREECQALSAWLEAGPAVLVVRALGGFGKSTLAWHWLLNDVDAHRWPRALWWSFYDERAFEAFLADTLTAFGINPHGLGPRQQADKLLELLCEPGTLLILDGFERALRAFESMNAAYQGDSPALTPAPREAPSLLGSPVGVASLTPDGRGESMAGVESRANRDCISPLAEHFLRSAASRPNLRGRVLLTTRLRPRVLEGHDQKLLQYCHEIELNALNPADALALFHAEGVRGTRAEIEAVCTPYGYHPLALRLLAGLIVNDLRQPGDIAVAQRLDVTGDLVQRQHHVLEQAYNTLLPVRQELLSQLACFRGPVKYEALRAIAGDMTDAAFDAHLHDLIARGLLHHDSRFTFYDLHPIVRRYAYDRLTDKVAAHARLRDYFVVIEIAPKPQTLEDLTPVIELYHHTVRAGQYDEARTLFQDRLDTPTYYQFGAYQLQIELLRALFPDGEDQLPRLKNEGAQASTLNDLACVYSLGGQPRRAVPLFERQNAIREKAGDKKNLAIGLGNVATQQTAIGALRAAEANLCRGIALCRDIEDERWEAVGHQELGHLLAYRGEWQEAEQESAASVAIFEKYQTNYTVVSQAYGALAALLRGRAPSPPAPLPAGNFPPGEGVGGEGIAAALRALELADEWSRTQYPMERDYVRAYWLLGAAYRADGNYEEAERHLTEALTRCRTINMVDHEADILIGLARLALAQANQEEAERLLQEALEITERAGFVLQGADAHLELARLALARSDKAAARQHAQTARQLATCDGEPYVYRVAYDEAERLLG